MTQTRHDTKLVRHGQYVAEVSVELEEADHEWFPVITPADLKRLSAVRRALETDDLDAAARHAKLYRLEPIHNPTPGTGAA